MSLIHLVTDEILNDQEVLHVFSICVSSHSFPRQENQIIFDTGRPRISDVLINHVFQSEHIIYHDCFEPCECLTPKYTSSDFLLLEYTQVFNIYTRFHIS